MDTSVTTTPTPKPKITLMKGLPACGKTTHAQAMVTLSRGRCKRVSKDDLRAMLDNGVYHPQNEKMVNEIRDTLIFGLINAGYDVVVDETHLDPRHETRTRNKFGRLADIEVVFIATPLEDCIANDRRRGWKVGEKVIRDYHRQWLAPPPFIRDENGHLVEILEGVERGSHEHLRLAGHGKI